MKKYILLFTLVTTLLACDTSSKWKTNDSNIHEEKATKEETPTILSYEQKVNRYRDSTSTMFYSGANGILPKDALDPEGKLSFYSPNEAYRINAVFEPIENGEVFEMKTSTDRLPAYKKYGLLKFRLGEENLQLTLYQNVENPEYIFCPFKDITNGNETYGAGRYLDFTIDDLKNPVIDFNFCYNPLCAYNSAYSCPIPPFENHLKVSIEAGEKKWH